MHFWSCDITKHEIYKIGHISAIFKDRDFWFGPKNSIKSCAITNFGQSPKPIEFEFGPDQTMVISLISLMSKLLKGPISWKRYQIGIQLLLTLDRKS